MLATWSWKGEMQSRHTRISLKVQTKEYGDNIRSEGTPSSTSRHEANFAPLQDITQLSNYKVAI